MGNSCSSSKEVITHEEDIMVSKCIIDGKNDITEQLHSSASSFYKPGSSYYKPRVEDSVSL